MKQEYREQLTKEQDFILAQAGTEQPFSGAYNNHFEHGTYCCVACKTPLFSSGEKYHSSCGWPSFFDQMGNITEHQDTSHGMIRTEVRCKTCQGHLGHVFDDGPEPTHKRYCINSQALEFISDEKSAHPDSNRG